MDAHKNFAEATITIPPSPATSGTTATLAIGQGALLPTPPFNATVWPANIQPLASNAEIVRVNAISGDVITDMSRAQEGSTAQPIQAGYTIAATITAKTLTDIETAASQPGPVSTILGRRYLAAAGANTGYWTPDVAALDITTTLDLRCLLKPASWATGSTQVFFAKWLTTGNQRSWLFSISSTGGLNFTFSPNGTTVVTITTQSSVNLATLLTSGLPVWVRVIAVPNVGGLSQATFFYSYDYVTWTQLGAVRTNATPGPWFSGTANLFVVHSQVVATPYTGRLYRAEVFDNTTLVAAFDARGANTPPATFPDETGKVWTPESSAALIQDEVNDWDFKDSTLSASRLIGSGPRAYATSLNGATYWDAGSGLITSDFLALQDVMAALNGWHNVRNFGAPLDGINDDQPASQTVYNNLPHTNPVNGGVIYYPPPSVKYPNTRALLYTPIDASTAPISGLKIIGGGAHGGMPQTSQPGPTQIMVRQGLLRFNEFATNFFAGPILEDFYLMPAMTKTSADQALGSTVGCSSSWPITTFPSGTHDAYIQDAAAIGRFTYTGISGNNFTGVTIVYESTPGHVYTAGSTVFLANTYGLGPVVSSNIQMRRLNVSGFLDHLAGERTAGYCYWLNGSGSITQYNIIESCWFNQFHRGGVEDASSSRHILNNFDASNGSYFVPFSKGIVATDVRTFMFGPDTNVDGCEVNLDIAGISGGTGNRGVTLDNVRGEKFGSRHMLLSNLRDATVRGGTAIDSIISAVGTYLEAVGCTGLHVDMPVVSSVADTFIIDAATTGIFEYQGDGNPNGTYAGPAGSVFHQKNGVALADGGTGLLWIKKSMGSAPYKNNWIAVA